MKRAGDLLYILALVLLLLGAFLVIFDHAMLKGYFRDENQFIASGKLLQSEGLLPYRDYPYFHLPNLVFAYALIDGMTGFSLLGARSFSVLCSWGAAGALIVASGWFFRHRSRWLRLAIGAGGVLLLLPNPLFRYTTGLAWNHDFPVLLTLAAALLVLVDAGGRAAVWRSLGCGVLLGLAVGARLTFVTALPPFLAAWATQPAGPTHSPRRREMGLFLAGFCLALLPSFTLFCIAPGPFIFGNLEYARLNTAYRLATEFDGPLTLAGKLNFLNQRVLDQPGTQIVLALWAATLILGLLMTVGLAHRSKNDAAPPILNQDGLPPRIAIWKIAFLLSLAIFILIGSFLPAPSWYQYFYAPLPVLILGVLYGLSQLDRSPLRLAALASFFLGVLLTNAFHFNQYPNLRSLARPGTWYPIQTRVLGYKIKQLSGEGRVLTLSPLFPLDGGARIYPEFATGPFAWRVADFLNEEQRSAYQIWSNENLVQVLEQQPPGGILTGLTRDAEGFLLDYARQKGYNPVEISADLTLWIPK